MPETKESAIYTNIKKTFTLIILLQVIFLLFMILNQQLTLNINLDAEVSSGGYGEEIELKLNVSKLDVDVSNGEYAFRITDPI